MDIASLLLNITGNSADAKRALREVRDELRTMSTEQYKAQVELAGIAGARQQLRDLERSLDVIQSRRVTARVRVDIGDARAKLALLRRELELAGRGGAGARPIRDILGDIGALGGDIDQVNRRGGILRTTLRGLGSTVGDLGTQFKNTANRGLQSFLVNMIRMGITVTLIIPIIGALLGILGALVASLSFAVAGIGLLAVALGVALLPVLAVAAAGVLTLVRAAKALKDQQEKERVAAEAVASARDSLKSANERVEESNRSLQESSEALAQAATEANKDWADSIEKVKDDLLAVQYAQLGITQSNLNVKKAAQDLKAALKEGGLGEAAISDQFKKFTDVDFDASSIGGIRKSVGTADALDIQQKVIDYKRALLDQKGAQDTLSDSNRQLREDQQKVNDYTTQGIEANEGYRNALKAVEEAERQRSKAVEAQTIAQRKLEGSLAHQKKIVEEFDPATKKLAERMGKLKDVIIDTFGPLGARIGNAALGALEDIFSVLKDPVVKENLDDIADSLAGFFRDLGRSAKSDAGVSFFRRLTDAAASLARNLGRKAFGDFVRLMARLAEATFPYLLSLARKIAGAFDDWDSGAKNTDKLRGGIKRIMDSLRDWWGLIKAVSRAFLAFIRDGKDQGDGLVRTLTRWVNKLADFLNTKEGRQEVIDWIKDSIKFGKDFFNVLKTVYTILSDIIKVIGKAIEGYQKIIDLKDAIQGSADARKDEDKGQSNDVTTLKNLNEELRTGIDKETGKRLDSAGRSRDQQAIYNIIGLLVDRLRADGMSEANIDVFLRKNKLNRDGSVRRRWGGLIPGVGGFGDNTLVNAEGGEYMLRRSVVAQVGVHALDRLNAGAPVSQVMRASAGSLGGHTYAITLPPAPAAAIPDARYQATQLFEEVKRRGGS